MRLSEPYIVVIVVAVAMVFFWLISGTVARRREKKITASRPSENVETFVASLRPEVHVS